MTSFYEEMAADALADRDPIPCQYCWGRGWVEGDMAAWGGVEVLVCRGCDGEGEI